MPKNKSFSIISLGCPKNRVDTERILAVMAAAGFVYADDLSSVNFMIINTCAFIESAVSESIDTILDFKAENPDAVLAVAGCLPLRYKETLTGTLPEVNFFITPDRIGDLPGLLLGEQRSRLSPSAVPDEKENTHGVGQNRQLTQGLGSNAAESIFPHRTLTTPGYAYLKIAEGCSRRCRYCTIPGIRGPLISSDPSKLEQEARFLVEAGVRELVFVAQDLTSYGMDRGEKAALVRLLDKIQHIDDLKWIRLMYLYPDGIKDDLLTMIRDSEKILPYLDIPFQHVADKVLKSMGRPWKGDGIRRLVDRIRQAIPGIVLRTTFMVGYPAEGDQEFQELRDFVIDYGIERVGVFAYSPEEGTAAAALGDPISAEVKEERAHELRQVHASFITDRNQDRIGSVESALIEGVSSETELLLQGRTWDQAPEVDGILYITAGKAVAGAIQPVRITGVHGPDLFGEIDQE